MKQKTITFFLALSAYGALMPTSNQPTDTTVNQKTESAPLKKRKKRLRPAIIAAIVAGSAITIGGLIALVLNSRSYKHGRNYKRRENNELYRHVTFTDSIRYDLGIDRICKALTKALEEYTQNSNEENFRSIRSLITGVSFPYYHKGGGQGRLVHQGLIQELAEACEEVIKKSDVKFNEAHAPIIKEHIELGKKGVIQTWGEHDEDAQATMDDKTSKTWRYEGTLPSGFTHRTIVFDDMEAERIRNKFKLLGHNLIFPCLEHDSRMYFCTAGYDPTDPESRSPHYRTYPLLTRIAASLP